MTEPAIIRKISPRSRVIVMILFLSPAIGELLSGSAPPLEFFHPFMFIILILLYGCGTLLIREARARWGLQWSIILLAVAYGIVEEGLMVKSFFNPGWEDLNELSQYGEYGGVQWVWTIMLTAYHATISTLIPITIVDFLWPKYRNVSLLGKRGLRLALGGISAVTLLGAVFFGTMEDGNMTPYHPHPLLMVSAFALVLLLIRLAYVFRNSRLHTDRLPLSGPIAFGIAGFAFQALNLLPPYELAKSEVSPAVTITGQLLMVGAGMLLAATQLCHKRITSRHVIALVFGSLLFWITVDVLIQGALHGMIDMFCVGVLGILLLVWWRRAALRNQTVPLGKGS